jgi:hypothetical protein
MSVTHITVHVEQCPNDIAMNNTNDLYMNSTGIHTNSTNDMHMNSLMTCT